MICSYDICQEPARFQCLCKSSNLYLCPTHSSDHCLSKGPHELQNLYTHLSDSQKALFIKSQLKTYEILHQLTEKITKKCSELIHSILTYQRQVLNDLNNKKSESLNHLTSVLNSNSVPNPIYQKYLETEDFDLTIDPLNSSKLDSELFDFFSQDFSIYLKLVPSRESSELLKSFVWFEKNSKKVIEFDLLCMESRSFEVESEDFFGDYAGWCQLPQRKVFHYGGQLNRLYSPLMSTYFIDVDFKKVEKKADGINKKYTVGVCAFFKPFVYVFGGSGMLSSLYSDCEKYNVYEDKWSSICCLPFGSDYNCAIVKDSGILVSGYRLGVLFYDIGKDCYENLMELNSGAKILLLEGSIVYLLFGNKVFVKDSEQWVLSEKRNILSEEVVLLSYPVKRGTSFYFAMSDSFLYKFNLVNGNLDRIKLVQSQDFFDSFFN
jgi:hypothetical protein